MKQYFDQLEKNVNDSIILYKELENLYEEKKKVLLARDVDNLSVVDEQILKVANSIKPYIHERAEIFKTVFKKDVSLSAVIQECKNYDQDQANRFNTLKEELNISINNLQNLDYTNLELTKFGIKLANKSLQIILNNISIPTSEYDSKGKVLGQESLELSSVSEEA